MSAPRNTQLDGWRAFAVLGVMWLHWAPREWRGALPFEIGLYFFLTLTGFLITRVLLRDRDAGEKLQKPWRKMATRHFLKRRAIRILIPCYAAMAFAWICAAPDMRAHPWVYLTHVSNLHMAYLPDYPSGTAHYWTLAIQMQFYFLWPLLIFFSPRRMLAPLLTGFVMLAPLSRWVLLHHFPEIPHPGAISTCAADYFAVGALLALAMERGMQPGDCRVRIAGWIAFASYVILYCLDEADRSVPGLRHFQQTFVSILFAALISATLHGFTGPLGRILEHPVAQHIGRISYGLYLFHTTVPLALGTVMPILWHPVFEHPTFHGPLLGVRLIFFALASWGVAWLCWRYLEQPLDRFRQPSRAA
ncbi:acyltransferase [Luteolibacter flavescens]|uniref:Acyltransferase n=1 Tax=Luteolibacter flavescens TaxID=1859460 RepID=A0ABT3FLL4_9BACT|nr:acyltransferase [Luteolibacter flavescens]MCW1884136.1 acyltransferase [Luteolibacter flavescens]